MNSPVTNIPAVNPRTFNTSRQGRFLQALWFPVMICLIPCGSSGSLHAQNQPPNIVLLLADDLGYGELGCQGNDEIPTPHIDSLARNGIRFTDGYVTAAFCSASRAGLLTGRYQTRFGYEFNPIGAQNEDPAAGLPVKEITLGQHLHRAGYRTGLIGKWHLGGTASYHPLRRGFDEFFGFMHEGHFFVPPPYDGVTTWLRRQTLPNGQKGRWTSPDKKLLYSTHLGRDEPAYDADNPIYRGGQPIAEATYLTDAFTREAVDFIERNADQPFFLYLAYNAVHSPLQGADHYMQRFRHIEDPQRRIFAAMLSNLDDSVGEILDQLTKSGVAERTLVFFLSDNGGPTRELTSSNLPLRGGKGDVFEGGIRIPFLCQWKGTLPAGKTYTKPVISLDIFATASAAAKTPLPVNRRIDGKNLLPYLQGTANGQPHNELFWRLHQKTAIRVGDWKLLRNPRRGVKTPWQLYHLAEDLSETSDLATARADKVEQLQKAWNRWQDQMIEPVWNPRR